MRFWSISALSAGLMAAQAPYPMRFVDDVGNLDNPYSQDKRKSADLAGMARVSRQDGAHLFEGRDDAGKPWRLFFDGMGGVGWTEVWTADFDRNGRPDLLIGSHFPGNGRCVDGAEVLVLLFDAGGRPVPWMESTMVPEGDQYPFRPAIVTDRNGDGRAEIVTTSCEYSELPRFGEIRRITGVYEARNARWEPLRGVALERYRKAAGSSRRGGGPGFGLGLPVKPGGWPDQMSGMDAAANLTLDRMLTGEVGCGGIRLTAENGIVRKPAKDPCVERSEERAVYSDGRTRRGWPPAVIDGPEGRDIYVAKTGDALRRILRGNYPLRLLGGGTSPAWIWADARPSTGAGTLGAEVHATSVTVRPLQVVEVADSTGGPFDVLVSRGAGCYAIRPEKDAASVACHHRRCTPVERLRRAGVSGPLVVKESMAWEVGVQRNLVRTFRSDDGGALGEYRLTAPQPQAELVHAVEFGQGLLVQWRVASGMALTLHDAACRPLTGLMAAGVRGELLAASPSDGMTFVEWKDGRPIAVTRCAMSVSWKRP